MARFNFTNVGAAMGDSLRQHMMEREAQRRFELEQVAKAEELKLRQAADTRAAMAQEEAAKTAALNRQAMQGNIDRAAKGDTAAEIEALGVGGEVSGELLERARRMTPHMIGMQPGAVTQGAQLADDAEGIPQYEVSSAPDKAVSKGSRRQQILKQAQENPNMTAKDLVIAFKEIGEDLTAGEANLLTGKDNDVSWQRFNGTREGSKDHEVFFANPKKPGEIVDSAGQKVQGKVTPVSGAGSEGMPFAFFPMQTGTGWTMNVGDRRTGDVNTQRVGDLRPGATAERELENGILVNNLIADIGKEYNPAKVGVLTGRLKNIDQQYWGSDPEYAKFKQNLTTLGNTIIQLRTGAQMSIQESSRILNEIANETLPPATFAARLAELQEQYREYVQVRAKLGFGRTTDADITSLTETGALPAGAPAVPSATPEYEESVVNGVKVRRRKGQ